MAENFSFDDVPSVTRLAAARRDSRYNIEIDELNKATAERIKKLCAGHNLFSNIEADSPPEQYKISIQNASLSIIEQIEGILSDPNI